jgi:hypothetical protein
LSVLWRAVALLERTQDSLPVLERRAAVRARAPTAWPRTMSDSLATRQIAVATVLRCSAFVAA